MSGEIFISYRRDDSSGWAGRLYDHISNHFPNRQIFMDVDNLDPGVDFVEAIETSVSSCEVLVAVIGKRWLVSSDDEGNRRLDKPDDFVRLEIAAPLKRNIRVIPILVDGASMPRSTELPDDLKLLVRRNALQVSHDRFRFDSDRLTDAIKRVFEKAKDEQRQQQEKERLEAEQHEKERLENEQRAKHLTGIPRQEHQRQEKEQAGAKAAYGCARLPLILALIFIGFSIWFVQSRFKDSGSRAALATPTPVDSTVATFISGGDHWMDSGQYQAAIHLYSDAIRLDPGIAEAYHKRGKAYSKLGENVKAQADFDQAEQLGYTGPQ